MDLRTDDEKKPENLNYNLTGIYEQNENENFTVIH